MSRTRNLSGVLTETCASALRRSKFCDVFERDPFKIQSYNFRYAERPAYPVQNFRRPEERQEERPDKAFATYYYNPNFMARHSRDNKENVDTRRAANQCPTKFAEFRRRKFLYESMDTNKRPVLTNTGHSDWFKQLPSATVTPQQRQANNNKSMYSQLCTAAGASVRGTKTSLLRTCCNRDYLQRRDSSTSCLAQKTASSNALTCPSSTIQIQAQTQQRRSNSQTRTFAPIQKSSSRAALARASVNQGRTPSSVALNKRNSTQLLNQKATGGTVRNSMPAMSKTTTQRSVSQTRSARRDASQTRPTPSLRTALGPRRSICSGCEINININAMDEDESIENVRIQIETDGCLMSKNTMTTPRQPKNTIRHARSRSMADYSRSPNFVVHIDKHLSKQSLNGVNHNVTTQQPPKRNCAQEAHEAHEAERASARERERERERLRELDREKDKQHFAQREREREHERQLQVENEKLAQMSQRLHMLNELKRKWELERAMRQIRAPVVPMTSHLYRQASTERIPSIVPLLFPGKCSAYCSEETIPEVMTPTISSLQPAAQAAVSEKSSQLTMPCSVVAISENDSQCELRAQQSRKSCNVLDNVRGVNTSKTLLERHLSQTSSKALLPAYNSSNLCLNQQRTALPTWSPFGEIKLINSNSHLRTTLNNMPLRITTSTSRNSSQGWRPLSDVAFRTVRVRNDLLTQPFTEIQPPCNLIYADKMRTMRL